jgi:hypothetical protein
MSHSRHFVAILVLLTACLAFIGCSGETDSGPKETVDASGTDGPPSLDDVPDSKGVPIVGDICTAIAATFCHDADDGDPCNLTGCEEFKQTCDSSICAACPIAGLGCVLSFGLICGGAAAACIACGVFIYDYFEGETDKACLCKLGVNTCGGTGKGTWDSVKNECNCECDPTQCADHCDGMTEPCTKGGGCYAKTNPPPQPQAQNECKCTELADGASCSADDQCDNGVCCKVSSSGTCQCHPDENCGGAPGPNPGADMCLFVSNTFGCCRCVSDMSGDGKPDVCNCTPSVDTCYGELQKTPKCKPKVGQNCPAASTGTCQYDPGSGATVAGCMIGCADCGVEGCGGCGGATGQDQNCGGGNQPPQPGSCGCEELSDVGHQKCDGAIITTCQRKDAGEGCGGLLTGGCAEPALCDEDEGKCYTVGWNLFGANNGGWTDCGTDTCVYDATACRAECVGDLPQPPPVPECTADSCIGCCGQDNICQPGMNAEACGTGGAPCQDCPLVIGKPFAICHDSKCFDHPGDSVPDCGNGLAESGQGPVVAEQCDGDDLVGFDCTNCPACYGPTHPFPALFNGGTLKCNADCTFDTSGCETPDSSPGGMPGMP